MPSLHFLEKKLLHSVPHLSVRPFLVELNWLGGFVASTALHLPERMFLIAALKLLLTPFFLVDHSWLEEAVLPLKLNLVEKLHELALAAELAHAQTWCASRPSEVHKQ